MKTLTSRTGRLAVLVVAGLLGATAAMAEKPEHAGGGKKQKTERAEKQRAPVQSGYAAPGGSLEVRVQFGDAQRAVVHDYYGKQARSGRCPPGLAKKNNGCMPPGQAKKWAMGKPLPPDVVSYPLPDSVVVQLGVPPVGHRYVRVAADILLIAIGTGIVIDAIQDLGRM